jgi:hypothetical protein
MYKYAAEELIGHKQGILCEIHRNPYDLHHDRSKFHSSSRPFSQTKRKEGIHQSSEKKVPIQSRIPLLYEGRSLTMQ